jgi:hypothetical protein
MPSTFAAILTAHLLGDFIFQARWMVEHKHQFWVLVLHVTVVTSISYLLLGTLHWPILLVIFQTHLIMDAIKVYGLSDSLVSFLADQFAHFAVLAGLSYYFPDAANAGWWVTSVTPGFSKWYFAALSLISGLILCIPAGGILIGKMITPFACEIGGDGIQGLTSGGQIYRLAGANSRHAIAAD